MHRQPHPRLHFRRLVALGLTALLLLPALAGCSKTQTGPYRGQLSVWLGPVPGTLSEAETVSPKVPAPITQAVSSFESAHPGVNVKVTMFSWPELGARLKQAAADPNGRALLPDVVAVAEQSKPDPTWLSKGLMESLDSPTAATLKDAWPFAADAFRSGNSLYGVPVWTSVQALYLNLDLFDQRGVAAPASGRWTYDEFARDVARLSYIRPDGIPVAGLGVAVRSGYNEVWPFLYADGARAFAPDGKSLALDSPAGLSSLSRLVALKRQTASPWLGTDQVGGLFQAFTDPSQRSVAIVAWDSWALAEIQRSPAFSGAPLKLGLAAYPTVSDNPLTIGQAGGFVAFKQSTDAARTAVMDLLRALSDTRVQVGLIHAGAMPALTSLNQSSMYPDSLHAQLAGLLPGAELPPRVAGWSKVEPVLVAELGAALAGRKLPAQALADASKTVNPLLGGTPPSP